MIEALPAIISAVALVLTAVASVIAARRTGRIETKVNGTATALAEEKRAMEAKLESLRKQLAQLVVERKDERAASQQARADVQAGIASPPPEPDPVSGD